MYNAIELCHCTGNRLFEQNKNAESAFFVAKIHLKESKIFNEPSYANYHVYKKKKPLYRG